MDEKITRGVQPGAIKALIYGVEGVGKSTLAGRIPGALFIDLEGSTRRLDVARLERPGSWEALLGQVRRFRDARPVGYGALVIDTADWAEQLAIEAVVARHQAKGIEDFGYGKGWVYLHEEFGKLLNLLSDIAEGGAHAVLVAHAQITKFEQPDQTGAYDRWSLKLSRRVAATAKEWADEVFFLDYETVVVADADGKARARGGTERVIRTQHSAAWDAKDRFGLAARLPLDWEPIAPAFAGSAAPAAAPAPAGAGGAGPGVSPDVNPDEEPDTGRAPGPGPADGPGGGPLPALRQLMAADGVTEAELMAAVAHRGYYPADMALADLDPEFLSGWAVALWPQVSELARSLRAPAPATASLDAGVYDSDIPF